MSYHQENFHQTLLCLKMPKINYLGTDSQSLNQCWLLSHVEPSYHLAPMNHYSAGHGNCRDSHSNYNITPDEAHKLTSLCEVFNQVLDLVMAYHTLYVMHSDLHLDSEQSNLSGCCFTSQLSSTLGNLNLTFGNGTMAGYPYKEWIMYILFSPYFSAFFSGLVKVECLNLL